MSHLAQENLTFIIEWLPVTSRSHRQTDKCKISIIMIIIIMKSNDNKYITI